MNRNQIRHTVLPIAAILLTFMSLSTTFSVNAVNGQSLDDAISPTGRYIGTAIRYPVLEEGTDQLYQQIAAQEFNVITPESMWKFAAVHPEPNRYDFTRGDYIYNFARENGLFIRGHALVWHIGLPSWINNRSWTRSELLAVMEDHIHTVMNHYDEQVVAWDVVNEAINWDGTLRNSVWKNVIGPEFVDYAFRFAHEADPNAVLYYNDYSAEEINRKSDGIYELVRGLVQRGVPIHGVGMQTHTSLGSSFNLNSVRANIQRFVDLGLEVQFTEVDVSLQGGTGSYENKLQQQAQRYRDIAAICGEFPECTGIVFWGYTDNYSWVNNRYGSGTDAMLFDRNYQPKPAYFAVREEIANGVPVRGVAPQRPEPKPLLTASDDQYSLTAGQSLNDPAPGVLANDQSEINTMQVTEYTQPSGGSAIINPDGSLTYAPFDGFSGQDTITYTISDGQSTASATVTLTVTEPVVELTPSPIPTEPQQPEPPEQPQPTPIEPSTCQPIYRVNAGGEELAALDGSGMPNWSADTRDAPSPYVNAGQSSNKSAHTDVSIDMTDSSLQYVRGIVPEAVFQNERYNINVDVPMRWRFPVSAGEYTVRLYLAELFFEVPGQRAYDILIEGQLVQDNFEPFAYAGSDMRGFMQQYTVTADSTLDIEFVNQVENAAVMGLEILSCNGEAPTVNFPPVPQNDTINATTGVPVTLNPLLNDTDPDGDSLTLVEVFSINDQNVNAAETIVGSSGGTIVHEGNLLTYTAAPNFEGTEMFSYIVSDGMNTVSAVITINVQAPVEETPVTEVPVEPSPEPSEPSEPTPAPSEPSDLGVPSISPVSDQNTSSGSAVNLQIQAVDPDGSALRYIAEGLPAGLSMDAASGVISGVPTQAGTFPVSLRVVAADGDEASASFIWTVTGTGGGAPTSDFLVEIKRNGTDNEQQAQFEYKITNVGASAQTGFALRFYFTVDSGQNASSYVLEKYWDESGSATVSGPTQHNGSVYYFTVSYAGTLNPGASWKYHGNIRLQNWSSSNNTTNDWWRSGGLNATMTATNALPIYRGGTLVYGQEPNASGQPAPAQPQPAPVQPTPVPARPTVVAAEPTPAPAQPGAALNVEIKTSTVNNQQAQFQLRLHNTGGAQSNISMRLYFTVENGRAASDYVLDRHWDQSGTASISGPTQHNGNTYYYTINYGSTSLASNATWEFHGALRLNDWRTDFNGGNDWWLGVTGSNFTATNRIPVYVSGSLTTGSQP